jgi:CheY-like chemotaxis protein
MTHTLNIYFAAESNLYRDARHRNHPAERSLPLLYFTGRDVSMPARASVLIVDDDPVHLRIYGWIIEAAGYRALPAEVGFAGIDLPGDSADVVLLDYHLGGQTTAVEIAKLIQCRLPNVPVIVLSDAMELPEDIAPLVQGFVRKGDPAKLVDSLQKFLQSSA